MVVPVSTDGVVLEVELGLLSTGDVFTVAAEGVLADSLLLDEEQTEKTIFKDMYKSYNKAARIIYILRYPLILLNH